jgi:hypothetical protein
MVCLSAEEYMSFWAAIGRPRARSWAPPTALLLLVYCMGCHTMAITVGAALLPAVVAAQPATAPRPQLAVTTDGGLSAAPVETTSTFYFSRGVAFKLPPTWSSLRLMLGGISLVVGPPTVPRRLLGLMQRHHRRRRAPRCVLPRRLRPSCARPVVRCGGRPWAPP